MKWHLSFFVAFVVFFDVCCGRHVFPDDPKAETIDSLTFRTAQCSQCGMTVFGSVMTKVCGNVGCCLTPWDQGSFKEGGTDVMSGPKIGECDGFAFNQGNSPDGVGITLFHQGSDALELEFISISTNNGTMYQCQMPDVYVDNSDALELEFISISTNNGTMYQCQIP